MRKKLLAAAALLAWPLADAAAQNIPVVTSWLLNMNNATGFNGQLANVTQVRYSTTSVYVDCTNLASYTAGYVAPASGQGTPATNTWYPQPTQGPVAGTYTFRVPRNPQPNGGTLTTVPGGNVGLWINGVTLYNGQDASSYNNQGVWYTDAVVNEGIGFDPCNGHPNPGGSYHTHLNPNCLYNDRDSTRHSPIIGYAFDGYPIYGTYGYANANGTGGIKSMKSSYRLRNITTRTTLPSGAMASSAGPPVNAQNPLGKYVLDNEYVAGRGDLDDHNGRWCITPEYPNGTYAYFVTLNSFYEGAYPYTLGTTYYGVVPNWGNSGGPSGGHVPVNEPVTAYTGDLTISSAENLNAGAYRNVTVTGPDTGGAGVATLTGPVTINGDLTVQYEGKLMTESSYVSGPGSFTLEIGGTLGVGSPQGVVSGNSGAIRLTGTRDVQNGAEFVYNGTVPQVTGTGLPAEMGALTINNPAGVTLSQPASIFYTLNLNGGTLNTNGQTLTLLSSSDGSASALHAGTGAVSGNVTVERYISPGLNPGPGYRQLSAPVQAATINSLDGADFTPTINSSYNTVATPGAVTPFPTVFSYDQSRLDNSSLASTVAGFDRGWVSPAALTDAMSPTKGFTVNLPPTTFAWVGALNTGTLTTPGLGRGTHPESGWHCVGNPYASTLDWSVLVPGLSPNLASSMYFFESSGPYTGSYRSYVNGIGNPLIPSSGAFFVRSITPGQSPTLSFTNAARTDETALFYRGTDPRPRLELSVADAAGRQDRTTLYWQAGATTAADAAFDAWKVAGPAHPQLWTEAGADRLSINGLPLPTGAVRVPLSLSLPQAGSFTLRPTALANLPATWTVQLEDRLSGRTQALTSQTNYQFTAATAGSVSGRFCLVLNAQGPLTNANAQLAAGLSVHPNPAREVVQVSVPAVAGATQAVLTLSDALGRTLRTQTVALSGSGALTTLSLSALAPGVYVLRTQAGAETVTRRLVVE